MNAGDVRNLLYAADHPPPLTAPSPRQARRDTRAAGPAGGRVGPAGGRPRVGVRPLTESAAGERVAADRACLYADGSPPPLTAPPAPPRRAAPAARAQATRQTRRAAPRQKPRPARRDLSESVSSARPAPKPAPARPAARRRRELTECYLLCGG